MQKINFSDKIALTEAVMNGNKTMTRRVLTKADKDLLKKTGKMPYEIGETVAIAQSYKDCLGYQAQGLEKTSGYKNKLFVQAEKMPHAIQIVNARVELLQDISEHDCIAEGVIKQANGEGYSIYSQNKIYTTAQDAYRDMLKIASGKDVWDENPLVAAYEFVRVK